MYSFTALRIIPAYAGQINDSCSNGCSHKDHPRIRGTNRSFCFYVLHVVGSSPHTRDKSPHFLMSTSEDGIIPAYAGQMRPWPESLLFHRDHPRIRGTNQIVLTKSDVDAGSSPHTRDKFRPPPKCNCRSRIIPAYAGQIYKKLSLFQSCRDHPRIRGTNRNCLISSDSCLGSSPHTRDK